MNPCGIWQRAWGAELIVKKINMTITVETFDPNVFFDPNVSCFDPNVFFDTDVEFERSFVIMMKRLKGLMAQRHNGVNVQW